MERFMSSLNIPASGLTAEMYRLNLISQNITNAESTRRADGRPGPYRRKIPVYQEVEHPPSFADRIGRQLAGMRGERHNIPGFLRPNGPETRVTRDAVFVRREMGGAARNGIEPQTSGEFIRNRFPINRAALPTQSGGVRILKIIEDPTPGNIIFDPTHPDANEEGYVEMPNVEMLNEMVNMMGASRSYDANVQVVNAMRTMAMRALDIGR